MATSVRARSEVYAWLAIALYIPDNTVVDVEFAKAGQIAWGKLFSGLPSNALNALEQINREPSRSLDAVQREYARLFLGPPHAIIHPYQSCYFGEERLMTAQTVAVGAFLKECGVVPDHTGAREPVDHIAVELEFLAIVCAGELETVSEADSQEIESRFLRDHLGQWGRLISYDIRAATEEPLYLAAAELLDRVLEHVADQPA